MIFNFLISLFKVQLVDNVWCSCVSPARGVWGGAGELAALSVHRPRLDDVVRRDVLEPSQPAQRCGFH